MTTTITANATAATTTPVLVLGYETERESRNIVYNLISGDLAVTLIPPRPRSGTLELLYETESEAFAALNLHAAASTFTLTDDDRPSVDMTYVIDGRVSLALDEETRDHWTVSVTYQEVNV